MSPELSIASVLVVAAAATAWVRLRGACRIGWTSRDSVLNAALRREEKRQRPWEARN